MVANQFNTIICDTADFSRNLAGDISYNAATGLWTINNPGMYMLTATLTSVNTSSGNVLYIWANNTSGAVLQGSQHGLVYPGNLDTVAGTSYITAGTVLKFAVWPSASWNATASTMSIIRVG